MGMRLLLTAIERMSSITRPPVPPFTFESATKKVKGAQDLWNTRDPAKVALAYTENSIWRNRDKFFSGHQAIIDFLTEKWARETQYRLRKELFSFTDNKIAVNFWYEYFDVEGKVWKRTYGLEHWTFEPNGLMAKRHMSGNEIVVIPESERWFKEGVDVNEVEISDIHG
ncbi:hypothetical protein PLICRDRAFT_161965 [Plicaturopsis crispa FD-325 SS-3]|nr:hypothetical protein PLICRDRAFT_161965 [Plicaturopsis crispa FD-325 SS-3]